MNETEFVNSNKEEWEELRNLSLRLQVSPGTLLPREIERFLELYRKATSDLARARAESTNPDLIGSLNNLVAQGYSSFYSKPKRKVGAGILNAIVFCAQAFRRQYRFVLLSLFTVIAGTMVASLTLANRPDLRYAVIPPSQEELFTQWKKAEFEQRSGGENLSMLAMYASNNPNVSLRTAAIGASTLGIGSAYSLWQNGILLGALGQDMRSVGKLGFLATSLAPHGATELSGMIISGASGYSLGWAILVPGRRRRIDSLVEKSKDAMALFVMGVVMMYIAAPFEAFFSFSPAFSQPLKAIVGLIVFALWMSFWLFAGRTKKNVSKIRSFVREPSAQPLEYSGWQNVRGDQSEDALETERVQA